MGACGLLYLKEEILDSWKVNQTYCNKYGQKNASACSQYIYLRNFNEKNNMYYFYNNCGYYIKLLTTISINRNIRLILYSTKANLLYQTKRLELQNYRKLNSFYSELSNSKKFNRWHYTTGFLLSICMTHQFLK